MHAVNVTHAELATKIAMPRGHLLLSDVNRSQHRPYVFASIKTDISDAVATVLCQPSASRLLLYRTCGIATAAFTAKTLFLSAEGVMTNGSGMVQFSRGFMRFGRSLPIVPVALRVTVPWNIQTHTLTSNFAANLFWFCFVPWVRLDATVLKPMSLSEVRHAQTSAHAV